MKFNMVYFSLGSNLFNRKKNLIDAIFQLKKNKIKPIKISSIYETEPVGFKNQPYFYNICLKAKTSYKPEKLLKIIKKIEKKLGRKKTKKWGPRIIDIDILFYNNIIFNSKILKLPHPEIARRKFVLKPMLEIEKNFIHPVYNLKIKDLIKKFNLKQKVKKVGKIK